MTSFSWLWIQDFGIHTKYLSLWDFQIEFIWKCEHLSFAKKTCSPWQLWHVKTLIKTWDCCTRLLTHWSVLPLPSQVLQRCAKGIFYFITSHLVAWRYLCISYSRNLTSACSWAWAHFRSRKYINHHMQLADDRQLAGADVFSLVTCFILPQVTNVNT